MKVALVSIVDRARTSLAEYLRNAGFDVHVCEELAIASSFAAVILLGHEMTAEQLRVKVRSWLKGKPQTIVVVTARPSALELLRTGHPGRLVVFPPPVFGWDVVDALRAGHPSRPRSA